MKALVTDLYELAMSYVYFKNGMKDKIAYFDVFYRSTPDNGGYVIACGLESIIEYIKNFKFEEDDIEFLRKYGQKSLEIMGKA